MDQSLIDAKLVVVGGPSKSADVPLQLPAIIGRGSTANITISHPLVSREHCKLYASGGKLVVQDLGSLNGTYIGHDRVTESIIEPGGTFSVGAVTFRAIYSLGAPSPDSPSTGDGAIEVETVNEMAASTVDLNLPPESKQSPPPADPPPLTADRSVSEELEN